jgi:hypothetical protein
MKVHSFDVLSFLAGLVITAIGLTFLLLQDVGEIIDLFTDGSSWIWPVVFITVGIAVLIPLAFRSGEKADGDQSEETGTV